MIFASWGACKHYHSDLAQRTMCLLMALTGNQGKRGGGIRPGAWYSIDALNEISAIITKASAENLELAIGKEVFALVKSSSVMLTTERSLRLTARNQLWGEVVEIHEGPVNNEVTLALPSGRSVTCVVTADSCEALGLAPGVAACAFFKSSSVILAAYG